jgi:uncharacterized repeat protein (TIGR03987 family)
LKPWHGWIFLAGVSVDMLATWLPYVSLGGLVISAPSIFGFVSLGLMALHLIWALQTLKGGNEQALTRFHRFSLLVWTIWMLSYLSGFVSGIMHLG